MSNKVLARAFLKLAKSEDIDDSELYPLTGEEKKELNRWINRKVDEHIAASDELRK